MTEELKPQYKRVKDILEQHYLPVLDHLVDRQLEFLLSCEKNLSSLKKLGKQNDFELEYRLIKDHKKALLTLLAQHFARPVDNTFDHIFREFNETLNDYFLTIDETKVLIQQDERFRPLKSDSKILRVLKIAKSILFGISVVPIKTVNLFRKVFNQTQRPILNWTHNIQLRNLTHYYLKEQLSIDLLSQLDEIFEKICVSNKVLWQIDESFDHALDNFTDNSTSISYNEVLSGKVDAQVRILKDLKKRLQSQALYILEDVFEKYEFDYSLAGTIELSNFRFRSWKINQKHRKLNDQCKSTLANWHNTLLLIKEDWGIDLELYTIVYAAWEKYHNVLKLLNRSIFDYSKQDLSGIKDYFNQCKVKVEESEIRELEVNIKEELKSLGSNHYLNLLESGIEAMLDKDFPKLIDVLEAEVIHQADEVAPKRGIVKGADYEKPIKSSMISYVSTKELINFESLPQFEKVVKKVKFQISNNINEIQSKISELHQIAQFNLESALTLFDQPSEVDNPKNVALEGIDRTLEKLDGVNVHFERFRELFHEDLTQGLDELASSLIKLTSNENIYEIRIRIAKGKAIKRSIQIKEDILDTVRNIFPKFIRFIRIKYAGSQSWIRNTFRKYGLVDTDDVISTELADFLADTSQAVDRLPFVYRRLFKSSPLHDKTLFQGRKEELRVLNNAYNNWMKERFAASVVIGEKGSGVSSLINIYLRELSNSCEVIRFAPFKGVQSTDELLNLISHELSVNFRNVNELVKYLVEGEKRIVVVENIQLIFLKKVGGFSSLNQLMELISLTYKNVFWLMSCTAYSWDYLNKAISLSDHFSYTIKMKEFDNDTIIDIITRRHKISGYDVQFEASAENLNDKKFKKLKQEEQQNQLKKEFFSDLNKIAKSNVSLGLIYWMRSTKEISGNTLMISSLKDIDFSFMKSLSINKAYALMELLLHDGLSEKEFCDITNQTVSRSRSVLNPLREDGIINYDDEVYHINPLLYRQTVNLLRTKNIIH